MGVFASAHGRAIGLFTKPRTWNITKRGDRMPGGALSLTATQLDGQGHLVTVTGEVDIATAPQLAEYLTQFADEPLTVDLSGVSFLGSAGIATLLTAHRHAEQHGSRLTVRGATPIALRVLQIAGVDQMLNLEP